MKVFVTILLALAILLPLMGSADAQARRRSGGLMPYRARQMRAMRARQMQMLRMRAMHRRRRNRRRIPPWVYFKTPNDKGERKIELEDIQLWKTMDLNKDGKLTIAEYERFAKSADAQKFVRGMKERKAVEQWAAMIGIDVNKARAAMKLGAHHQRRRSYLHRRRHARVMAHRRRQAIARRNRMMAMRRRQQRTSYMAKLGQQYYAAMRRSAAAQRRGGEL